uniref:MRP-S28 domain-containing protein n=1 Tax=Panagrellus redivivus TaxID=6233 RepID=A0A7E4VQ62_PANRE
MISTLRAGSSLLPVAGLGRRLNSTLASRMKRAAAASGSYESEEDQRHRLEEQVDEYGEQFRELFINPKRKLAAQLQLERMTGRTEREKYSRADIHDRLAVRRPRSEEMPVDQDWPSVWPAAATYKSSVVPLPIRMGTRKKPEKRAPFKKVGNLELLKIPNFLHLTPEHIKRHCEAMKKFTTPFPPELIQNPSLAESEFPVTVRYSDYLHQGTSLRDPRARVNTIEVKLDSFPDFDEHAKDKFRHLVGSRFNEETNTLTIVTDRCYTRKQNREYADFLLTALYYEALKVESWEELKARNDNLKVEFAGSKVEKRIAELAKKAEDVSPSAVKEFAETWYEYRNQPETPELTRSYEDSVRKLLGISRLVETEKPKPASSE